MEETSNDECCICDDGWCEGQRGWLLCDVEGCENTVCPKCTSTLSLSVSELFYCPMCAGSGRSAAAAMGGSIAAAVAACVELEKLPLSFRTTKQILSNLMKNPEDAKYRKLRLENKAVKELVDLEPVLNILTSIGFVRKNCARDIMSHMTIVNQAEVLLQPMENVLLLEGPLQTAQINGLLKIMGALALDADGEPDAEITGGREIATSPDTETRAKRKHTSDVLDDPQKITRQGSEHENP